VGSPGQLAWTNTDQPHRGVGGGGVANWLLTLFVNAAINQFSHGFPGLLLTPQAAATALLTANGFLWHCSISNINNQHLIKTKRGKYKRKKQTALSLSHLSPWWEATSKTSSDDRVVNQPHTSMCIQSLTHMYTHIHAHTQHTCTHMPRDSHTHAQSHICRPTHTHMHLVTHTHLLTHVR
jgi:hypothetical protein